MGKSRRKGSRKSIGRLAAEGHRSRRRRDYRNRLRRALLTGELSEEEIQEKFALSKREIQAVLAEYRKAGANLVQHGERWSIDRHLAPAGPEDSAWKIRGLVSRPYRFGFISDTHLGSKHCRLEVIEELYDWFVAEQVDRVFHCGNWIDGEARFNRHELVPEAHGMQQQLDYFVEHYPERSGLTTYYVAGDDHEGWYSQREGVEIGRMLEDTARRAGRGDLRYLGYKEAFVTLEHPQTGKHARLLIDHPGGGTAYALSYAAQKRVEASQPGEKPALWAFGHWHKHGYFVIRGVHVLLVPCTKDLDTFGRKKGLEYTIGGIVCDIHQDPGGALVQVDPRFRLYFDRGYHNQQFNMAGPVRKLEV